MDNFWDVVRFICFIFVLVGAVVGVAVLCEIPPCNMYNEIHGTNYSVVQFAFCGDIIKNYNPDSGLYVNVKGRKGRVTQLLLV